MPKYTVDYLYNEFKALASMRSDSKYANDAGYWTDGCCNWGARHVLKEDCQTMAREFTKMESLDDKAIAEEFKSCTKKSEFDFKKSDLNRRLNELGSGLHIRTGPSSSMFGICIIWSQQGMNHHVDDKLKECQRDISRLKSQIENTKYEWVEELKRVQLEIKEIEKRMEEKKQQAMNEKDPTIKQKLLAEIETDGELLRSKYEERNQYTDKFKYVNISKHVSDLVEKLKRAVEGKTDRPRGGGSGGNGSGGNRGSGGSSGNPFGDGNGGSGNGNQDSNKPPRQRKEKDQKDNSQMILIALAVIVILFLMTNQQKSQRDEEFDYY